MNAATQTIASEVANNFAALASAQRFDASSNEENAALSGYIDTPQQEPVQDDTVTQTVEEITAQITQVTDTIALDSMAFVVKHAEQFADLGANFVAIAQRVDSMKVNLRLDLESLRELRSKRKRQDDAAKGELGAAFTEQVLLPALAEMFSGLVLGDALDADATSEVTMKSGEVRSVQNASMASGKVFQVQVNADGTFTVLQRVARIGNGTSATKPKDVNNDAPKAPRALSFEVYGFSDRAIKNGLDAIVPSGFVGTAKEIEQTLVQAGKIPLRTETSTSKYSVPERLRGLGLMFRQAA